MASRLFFAGRAYVTPTVASSVDDSRMAPQNPAIGNGLALVGEADGGQPNAVLTFSTPGEAAKVLKGGELLTAVRKAFSPSAVTGGPNKVSVVRVGTATRSTLTLKDASAADSIVLTSEVYGLYANAIRVSVSDATNLGKQVTVRLDQDYYTADNLGRNVLKLRYTGADASALVDVTATTLVLKSGAASTEATTATISLADFPTVQALADKVQSYAGWTAVPQGGQRNHPTLRALDGVTAGQAKTADLMVTAHLQAIVEWFNGFGEGLVTAARPLAATKPPANITDTYLSGAVYPATVLADWAAAFDRLTTADDVQWVVPLSANGAVHEYADAHVHLMSSASRKERRAMVGGGLGVTVVQAKANAFNLSSDRTSYVWPGHYAVDEKGVRSLLPGYMTAVHVAGGFAGMNPGNAMTNKTIRVQGLEVSPSNPAETDDLIGGGVLCLEETPRGTKVVRSISTWLDNDNFNRVEVSCGAATDFVARAVREALQPLVGSKASPQILARAFQVTDSILSRLARPEPAGPGVIVGDQNSPAFQNILVEIQGDALYVAFECSPVVPLNFIAIAMSIVPYNGRIRG